MKTIKWIPVLLVLALSCGTTEDTNIADGWAAFQLGNYEEAQSFFTSALTTAPKEANEGLGWVAVKEDQLPQARSYFLTSAGVDADTLIGAMAGLAIVSWQQKVYQESLDAANFVLSRQSTFTFEFDPTIVTSVLTLVQAYDYYHLGQFSACLSRIQVLDPGFASTTDPQALLNKLDALSATGT